ncbi:hypothetical protein F8M41_022710 [Gigaspora margarita]|uniref:Uncharacterized protein n=1 Tax=Gigaspora margarita TaxID=4874 RepID=A0A8H4AEN5_GIGMA|nr:hypothetical protein F8M41_022710 [Gigaspora margarita]
MWRDCFKGSQKSEPSSILNIRRLIIISSFIMLLGSIIALFFKMSKEQPIISTTFYSVDTLPAPDTCNKYVTQAEKTNDDDNYPFAGNFSPKTNINLHKYEDKNGPYFVFLDIAIVDPNFPKIINDSTQISSFRMIAFDSDNDYIIRNKSFVSPSHHISPFENSLYYMNKYTLSSSYIYKFCYNRNIRSFLSDSVLNYIGIPLSQPPRPYIESIIQPVPMSNSSTNNMSLSLRISPRSFIVGDEQEQRHSTVMGIFGTIAAIYSSLMFFYVFLFGVDSMRLWGVVHSGCFGIRLFKEETKTIINNDLESIITSDSNILNSSRDPQASSQDLQESSQDSQTITSRIKELEKFRCFIEMNVIKIKPWEGHVKVKESKKGNKTEV